MEKWILDDHFRDDAANGPDIDSKGIARIPNKDLRRAVPSGGYVFCEVVVVVTQLT